MHELAVTQSIVDQVTERLAGERVTEVTLEIGVLSGVEADSVRFCFDLVTEGTPLEGSLLRILVPEARAHCCDCGEDFVCDRLVLCRCGSAEVRIRGGDELQIKSVRVA